MSELKQALRYPWQGERWFSRLLPLALLQLIPLVGQLILIGYGLTVVRSIYHQQDELPPLQLRHTFVDGLRLVAVGLIYCFPVILMVLLALSSSSSAETENNHGIPGFLLPLIMLAFGMGSSIIVKWRPASKTTISFLSNLVAVVFIIFIAWQLPTLFSTMRASLYLNPLQVDPTAIPLLLIALVLLAVIRGALLVSGVQFATTGSGLLKPNATLQKMILHRHLTLSFLGSVWLLTIVTLVVAGIGSLFLLVPGLLLIVAGSVSIWFLAAQYALKIGS